MWEHCLKGLEADPLSLHRECDWVAKYRLIEGYRDRHVAPAAQPDGGPARPPVPRRGPHPGPLLPVAAPRPARPGVRRRRHRRGHDRRRPQTTRARLRGEFVKRAKEQRRDFTVDWVHLKLNDQAQRTVLLKDPFKSKDERVEQLIQSL